MRKLRSFTFAAMLCIAAVSPCVAAENPWNGTWKENLAKSTLGPEDRVSIVAQGDGYLYTSGSRHYYYAADGKPYPTDVPNQTVTVVPGRDGGYDFTFSRNGTVVTRQHFSISADNQQETLTANRIAPDGTPYTTVAVRQRKSGTTGLVGDWQVLKRTSTLADVMEITVTGDMLHLAWVHELETEDAKLDGSDGKVTGSGVPDSYAVTYKLVSPTKMLHTHKLNGKVTAEAIFTLSADGKVMTVEDWPAGKEDQKAITVLEKM